MSEAPKCEICAPVAHDDGMTHYMRAVSKLRDEVATERAARVEAEKERDAALGQEVYWHNRATEARDALEAAEKERNRLREAVCATTAALETEAQNYRDGNRYQPHGRGLLTRAKRARAALEGR